MMRTLALGEKDTCTARLLSSGGRVKRTLRGSLVLPILVLGMLGVCDIGCSSLAKVICSGTTNDLLAGASSFSSTEARRLSEDPERVLVDNVAMVPLKDLRSVAESEEE